MPDEQRADFRVKSPLRLNIIHQSESEMNTLGLLLFWFRLEIRFWTAGRSNARIKLPEPNQQSHFTHAALKLAATSTAFPLSVRGHPCVVCTRHFLVFARSRRVTAQLWPRSRAMGGMAPLTASHRMHLRNVSELFSQSNTSSCLH